MYRVNWVKLEGMDKRFIQDQLHSWKRASPGNSAVDIHCMRQFFITNALQENVWPGKWWSSSRNTPIALVPFGGKYQHLWKCRSKLWCTTIAVAPTMASSGHLICWQILLTALETWKNSNIVTEASVLFNRITTSIPT